MIKFLFFKWDVLAKAWQTLKDLDPMALQPPTGKFSASSAPRWQAAIRPQVCRLALVPLGFPGSAGCKESDCQCRRHRRHRFNHSWVIEWGRSHGEGHGNPLQYCCLEKPMDRGAWLATVHGIALSWPWLKQLSTFSPWCQKANFVLN